MNTLVATALVAGVHWSQRLPGPTIESPEEGSPGFAGFVATFLLAVAIIALAVSFSRRMRRATHRERLREAAGEGTVDGMTSDAARSDAATSGAVTSDAAAPGRSTTGDVGDPPAAPGVPTPGR